MAASRTQSAAYSAQSALFTVAMAANENAANLQARNAIVLRSYYMAPWKKSTLLSAVVDKGRRVFGNTRSTQWQSLPGDLHSTTNPLTSPPTISRKIFKKSNDARRDMSVLAMTYILQENSTIRELIRLIYRS